MTSEAPDQTAETDPARLPFELEIEIRPEDIDELGHVNNIVYLRWVQDAAIAHWRHATTSEQREALLWIVVRHEIEYKRAAFEHDGVIARTWIGKARRLRFNRHTQLLRASDRKVLAEVVTQWVPIDPTTQRPKQVGDDVRARFSIE